MDDDALLDQELHRSPRSEKRKRLPGANAITAIGLVVTLVLWAITGAGLSTLGPRTSSSGVMDPMAVPAVLLFGGELFVAGAIARRVWLAIGPGARGILRPLGALGPWPMIGIVSFAALWTAAMLAAPFLPRKVETPSSGRNWRLAQTGGPGVTYENAVRQCREAGERVPSRGDLEHFDPPFPGGKRVWIEKPADPDVPLALGPDGRFVHLSGPSHRADVLCFRP